MGEAKRRGTFEERKARAIAEGRTKREHIRKLLFRDYSNFFKPDDKEPPRPPVRLTGGTPVDLAVKNIVRPPIKQPGENRKHHKPFPANVQ